MECTAQYQPTSFSSTTITCHRAVRESGKHIGQHQAFEIVPAFEPDPNGLSQVQREGRPEWRRLWTWGEGGAQGTSNFDAPGANCMGCGPNAHRPTHSREDHRYAECTSCGVLHDTYRGPVCHSCTYWQERIDHYGQVGPKGERFVRPYDDPLAHRPWLYVWPPGHGGAFGGQQFEVMFDDGTSVGPADYLWSNGPIPEDLVEHFPPNAHVRKAEKIRRPGHTDLFGQPLNYNAHP